jgi:aminomethyltransferase
MEAKNDLRATPLYPNYVTHDAKIVEFAGWLMPIQFSGILKEHHAVRSSVGLFDVSHMGRLEVGGHDALSFSQNLTTNDLSTLEPGAVQYSTICNSSGGILDDVTVYRFEDHFLFVVNASNTEKIKSWMARYIRDGVELHDRSSEIAQLAIQGPDSQRVLQRFTSIELDTIPFYHFTVGEVAGRECMVSRSGYTGEDGFEIYYPAKYAGGLWSGLLDGGDISPCGLGARDLLRLEVKYCLYGNDIDESTTPLEAGLGWLVKLDKGDFIGRDVLLEQNQSGVKRKLIGFSMIERGIPRPGYTVLHNGEAVSKVASGAYSPSLDNGIGTAYLPVDISKEKTVIEVEIRQKRIPAEVVKPPFYRGGSRR